MILLDTHVLFWSAFDERQLGRRTRALIQRHWPAGAVAASAISFWEAALLQARGRLRLPVPAEQWRTQLLEAGLTECPLDGAMAVRSADLTGFPDDPADRFITATALVAGATLVTADEKILAASHRLPRHDART